MKPLKVRARKNICDQCSHLHRINAHSNGVVYDCWLMNKRVGIVKHGRWSNIGEHEVLESKCVMYLEHFMAKEET